MKLFGIELGNIGWIILIGLFIAENGFKIDLPWWFWIIPIPLFLISVYKSGAIIKLIRSWIKKWIRDMKRNNFGQIGIIIAVSTAVLHYFEIIDINVNGIISVVALVFLSISLYDRFTGKKWKHLELFG